MIDNHAPVVAVIDPVASGGPYGYHAKQLGIEAIAVLSQEFTSRYVTSSFSADDYSDVLRYTDYSGLDALVAELGSRSVGAVVPGAQTGVGLSDRLAARLGLLHNDIGLLQARVNKDQMKVAWRGKGLACADWHSVHSVAEAAALASKLAYPVIAKPLSSSGSSHVVRCDEPGSVVRAVERILTMPDAFDNTATCALIESYIDGPEYFANLAHSPNSEAPAIVCVASYEKVSIGDNLGVYRNFRSISPESDIAQNSIEYLLSVNSALGVRVGINDTEFKYTAAGPVAIEVNNRLPGALTPDMIEQCTGISLYQENLRLFFGAECFPSFHFKKNFIVCCLINRGDGILQRVNGLDLIAELPSYSRSRIFARVGDRVPPTLDLGSAWGLVCLVHEDSDQLEEDAEVVHQKLTLELK
ncbi:ATP-grasp domain-containing protein [Nocardia sp. NPDC051321]|uniref:ATP-grasp domain-containing protein n=1 Tax=Nocardia sp. NPDC051321 TaxID=3364323 RepID=UPI0037B0C7CE